MRMYQRLNLKYMHLHQALSSGQMDAPELLKCGAECYRKVRELFFCTIYSYYSGADHRGGQHHWSNLLTQIIDGLYGRIGPNWVVLDGLDLTRPFCSLATPCGQAQTRSWGGWWVSSGGS